MQTQPKSVEQCLEYHPCLYKRRGRLGVGRRGRGRKEKDGKREMDQADAEMREGENRERGRDEKAERGKQRQSVREKLCPGHLRSSAPITA